MKKLQRRHNFPVHYSFIKAVKGRSFHEEPFRVFIDMIKNVMLAIFACVLNSSACTTNITPMADDNPLFVLIGFAVSMASGIYSIRQLNKAARIIYGP
jgi:hypothetical protein